MENLLFDPILVKCLKFAKKGKVLDLGLGFSGRNSLFLAQHGNEVDGIDIDEKVVLNVRQKANDLNLIINAHQENILHANFEEKKYSLILANNIWHFLSRQQALDVIKKIKESLKEGGIIFLSSLSVNNICFDNIKKNIDFTLVDTNTYYSEKKWWKVEGLEKTFAHYFSKDEIDKIFSDFETIYISESFELDVDHGDPHYHGIISYVGRKLI